MNLLVVIASLGGLFLLMEAIFFLYCFRWLSSGKREREKDFQKLDRDRADLISLQSSVMSTLQESKSLAKETLSQLNRIGAEAHGEWNEMFTKMNHLMNEVDQHSAQISANAADTFQRTRLRLEKLMQESAHICRGLEERTLDAKKTLHLFDSSAPQDRILSEIQDDKYKRAKHLLGEGLETSEITKRLGISQSELALISFMR